MNSRELIKLVELMWKSTLTVDGRTRLKAIPISWRSLSPAQQSLVVGRLRRLIASELEREADDAALRLEFESIPRKLRTMLVDIGGDDNPDFTWGLLSDEVP